MRIMALDFICNQIGTNNIVYIIYFRVNMLSIRAFQEQSLTRL